MLTKAAILEEIRLGRIVINPFDPDMVNANSVDMRLGRQLLRITSERLDFAKPYETEKIIIPDTGYELQPGECYLGATHEWTSTPWCIPEFNGKSTTGRYFLLTHFSAGFGDQGFSGVWTLELSCMKPITVYPLQRIGQIYFNLPDGPIGVGYEGRYANSDLPVAGKPLV
jgi:dCTP deaminase